MKYIYNKANKCNSAYSRACKPHEIISQMKTSYWAEYNNQADCIPCEEISYKVGGYTLCPYNVLIPNDNEEIRYVGYIYCGHHYERYNDYENCQYCAGIDKEQQVVYCTYKSQHPEEIMEKKYRIADKPINMVKIQTKKPCKDFNSAVKNWLDMGYKFDDFIEIDDLVNVARKYNCVSWLISHGFIEEVEEEYYKVGDHFKWEGKEYVLAHDPDSDQINGRVYLINIDNGTHFKGSKTFKCIKNRDSEIPASEFHAWAGKDMVKVGK